jgi:hypothetical protein
MRRRSRRSRPRRAKRKWLGSASFCMKRTIHCSYSAAVAGPRPRAVKFTNSPIEPDCRSQPAIDARRCLTRCIRSMREISGSAQIRSWWRAPRLPICWCSLAAVSAKFPRRATHFFQALRPKPNSSTSILARRRSAASIGRILPSMPRRTALSPRSSAWPSRPTRNGGRARLPPTKIFSPGPAPPHRSPATSTSARS